jgi:DNA polymerase III delta prime subunit
MPDLDQVSARNDITVDPPKPASPPVVTLGPDPRALHFGRNGVGSGTTAFDCLARQADVGPSRRSGPRYEYAHFCELHADHLLWWARIGYNHAAVTYSQGQKLPDYDFHQLSAHDLEILTRDLLQAEWGVTIENFKAGKDGGIDLRFAQAPHRTIVQVKHFHKTGFAGLCRDLKKEAEKVEKLNPARYVVVTSVPLSPANKTAIAALFAPGRLKENDIVGQEGLNNLLGLHPVVEGQHFKLWLASRAVLDRVLNNAAITKSDFKAKKVYEQAKKYVESSAYSAAMNILAKNGLAIIAGPPGVGKTTLADLILYTHLEQGYQAIIIDRDVEEASRMFQEGTHQIFYFDDFMGATYLGENGLSSRNDDRVLLDFISMVRANSTARLVLTTREHIYSQAMSRSERLRNSDIDDYRIVLNMPVYSLMQRARILYNHLYFSELPSAYRAELLRDNFYLKIVQHEKFNPRLIEWLSTYRRVERHGAGQYQAFVSRLLADPSEIWRHAYDHQISEASKSLLLALVSTEGKVSAANLSIAFHALHSFRAGKYGFKSAPGDFNSSIRDLNGSFIKPFGAEGYEVLDPSVLDLMNSILRDEPANVVDIFAGACDFSQIEHVWKLSKSPGGRKIVTALAVNQSQFVARFKAVAMQDRRRPLKGGVAYFGTTFEARLQTTIDIAEAMPGGAIEALIEPIYQRLDQEHREVGPVISGVAEILRKISASENLPQAKLGEMAEHLTVAALAEAKRSCAGQELTDLVMALETGEEAEPSVMDGLRLAFAAYEKDSFYDELTECHSPEEFDRMLEDLELFRDHVGVDVAHLISSVEDRRSDRESEDYGRRQDPGDYGDRSDRPYVDQEVLEMFDTLKSDS